MELEALHTLTPSYIQLRGGARVTTLDFSKSHFKTLRLPLGAFRVDGGSLDLSKLARVRLVFDQPRGTLYQGVMGLDDLVFEK